MSNPITQDPNTGIIVLGDAGLNFFLNKTDEFKKRNLSNNTKCFWYLVRGNHEARPQSIPNIKLVYDQEVDGLVWVEEAYPRIRYFMDYGAYWIQGHRTLVIGGAYSVDKYYRLSRGQKMTEINNNPKVTGWFNDEQLSSEEMASAKFMYQYDTFDFIFTHTCPIDWEPTDLFLNIINQDKVDKSMEQWLLEMKNIINWKIWCFGHYHADRIERPRVEQFYNDVENIIDLWNRWNTYSRTGELDWWLDKSPNFYLDETLLVDKSKFEKS